MNGAEVSLFLCEVGELVIGVDCGDIHTVVPNAGSEQDRLFAAELFGRPVRVSKRARTLVMQHASGARVVVDRVLGLRSFSRAALIRIPASLRALGTADWVLGLAELEGRFVWLIDLVGAAPSLSRGIAS